MANKPQREIEKALSDYAAQRREAAGDTPPLHPATRRLLQGEAGRVWPQIKERGNFLSQFFGSRRVQFASLLAIVAFAGAATAFFLTRHQHHAPPSTIALNDYKIDAIPAPQNKAESIASAGESGVGTRRQLSIDKQKEPETPAVIPATSQASPALAKDKSAADETKFARSMDVPKNAPATPAASSSSVASLSPAVMAPSTSAPESANRSGGFGGGAAAGTGTGLPNQSPLIEGENNLAKRPVVQKKLEQSQLLNSFRIELAGNQVRVIDTDGSIYSGTKIIAAKDSVGGITMAAGSLQSDGAKMQGANFTNVPSMVATGKGLVLADSPGQPGADAFRVSGTNITTGKPIVFEGQFNLLPAAAAAPSGATSSTQSILLNHNISGHATIDGTNQIQINAVMAK